MNDVHLFHSISDEGESATVRKYITDHNLQDQIDFHNVHYDGSKQLLKELTGQDQAPCLVANGMVYLGKDKIIERLKQPL